MCAYIVAPRILSRRNHLVHSNRKSENLNFAMALELNNCGKFSSIPDTYTPKDLVVTY